VRNESIDPRLLTPETERKIATTNKENEPNRAACMPSTYAEAKGLLDASDPLEYLNHSHVDLDGH